MKPVCECLPASPVGEHAAEDPYLLRWQCGSEKLAALLPSWQAAYPIFSLVRAASQPQWQAAVPIFLRPGAEDEAKFTRKKRRVDASQLLKGQSEHFLRGRRFMFEA
jgi:hypothetical protein